MKKANTRSSQRKLVLAAAATAALLLCAAQSEGAPLMVHAPGAASRAAPANKSGSQRQAQQRQAPQPHLQAPEKPLNLAPSGAASLQRITVQWTVPDQGDGRVIQHWEVRACPTVLGSPYAACLPVLESAAGQASGATVQAQVPSHIAYSGRSTPVNGTEVCSVNPKGTSCADRLALRFPNPAAAPAPMRGMAPLGGMALRGAPSTPGPHPGIGIAPSGGIHIARGIAPQMVRVGPGTSLRSVLALPDNAVLQGPKGQRMTVAEFKQKREQLLARLQSRRPSGKSAGKSIRVPFSRHGKSLAHKIAGLRASEIAAARRVMASPGFKRGGQLPAEHTQSGQGANLRAVSSQARIVNCALRGAAVGSVNGRRSGIVFTPGGEYAIVGCGFGNLPGKAYVVGSSATSGNVAVQIPLVIRPQDWGAQAIHATIDARLSGIGDISNATLVVQPAHGAPLQQGGDRFYATRETQRLLLPSRYIEFNASPGWVVRYYPSRGLVNRGYCANLGSESCSYWIPDSPKGITASTCADWPSAAKDVWRLDKVIARIQKAGFEIDYGDVVVQNMTKDVGQNGSGSDHAGTSVWQDSDLGSFSSWQQAGDLYVQFQGHSEYMGDRFLGIDTGSHSVCYSSYAVSLSVSGPRGVLMPSL